MKTCPQNAFPLFFAKDDCCFPEIEKMFHVKHFSVFRDGGKKEKPPGKRLALFPAAGFPPGWQARRRSP